MSEVVIEIANQSLAYFEQGKCLKKWKVSTAKNGAGCQEGSYQTPLGQHLIRAKIGEGMPIGGVFVARRFTGQICSPELMKANPDRDWILTRILWLSGCEPNRNRLGNCDTMRRYIYIHGTPDSEPMGTPKSHGCIRMRNEEIVELFDLVSPYTPVLICE